MNHRNLLRILVTVAVIGYFASTYFNKPGPAAHTLAAPIPAHASAFMIGSLQFQTCELAQKQTGATTAAFCAPFSVPENRDAPALRKIDLKLALIRSDAEAADTDIVVFLAGGPGQAATEAWPQISGALAPLRKHHHILLLDQRGTGASHPIACAPTKNTDADEDRIDLDAMRSHVRQCLADVEKNADPRAYTTTAAVEDLEAVRQALGAPQFDLVGVSYGTRMAQQYLVRHADAVRSVVLDSVAPNELVLGEDFAVNLEDALRLQFVQCTQSPQCAKAFGDPYVSLQRLRDTLRTRPQDFDFRDPVTFAAAHRRLNNYTLAGLVRIFAYTPETAALLPLSIAAGLQDDYTPLAGQTLLLAGDLSELRDSGMQLSVFCAEDADLLTPRPQDAGTLLGTSMIDVMKAECEIWPHGMRPADFHAPLKTDKPVLILEGEFDPVTPPRYGRQVLKGLTNGRLLIAKGQGHNVIGRGCMPKMIGEFVDKLKPEQIDATCLDRLGPTPAFIDFSGPSP
ncbi:MAG: alpha/beta hydrolase [Rudaea sp.]|nr:alpha/beta hydrolase [Rudaea sp.]